MTALIQNQDLESFNNRANIRITLKSNLVKKIIGKFIQIVFENFIITQLNDNLQHDFFIAKNLFGSNLHFMQKPNTTNLVKNLTIDYIKANNSLLLDLKIFNR